MLSRSRMEFVRIFYRRWMTSRGVYCITKIITSPTWHLTLGITIESLPSNKLQSSPVPIFLFPSILTDQVRASHTSILVELYELPSCYIRLR